MEKNFVAKISAVISNFQRNIRKAQRMAKTDIPDEIETEVDAKLCIIGWICSIDFI